MVNYDGQTIEKIKKLAYLNWEARGKPVNDKVGQERDWKTAEEFVLREKSQVTVASPTSPMVQRITKRRKVK